MILGFGNNVKGSIAADISANTTVIPVMPGTGALFASTLIADTALSNPSITPRPYAKLTLTDEQETIFEICHLISVSGDNLTVIRGQEGTTARTWYLDDHIANFATRGSENLFIQVEDLQNGKYTASVAGGTANDLTIDVPTNFFANGQNTFNLRTPLYVIPSATNTGQATVALTMSGNIIGTFPLTKGNNQPLKAGDIVSGLPVLIVFDAAISVFQLCNPALGLLDVAEANKFYLRIDRNLSEIAGNGAPAQQAARENIDVFDATLVKKGLARLTDLSDPADFDSITLALTPRGLKKVTDALAPLTVPVGGAMLWFAQVPPDGWLEANGQSFDVVENPKLLAVYPSGHVPDCRGYFLRGWDNGAGIDPDVSRAIGSTQGDAFKSHDHALKMIRQNGGDIPASVAQYEINSADKNDQRLVTFDKNYAVAVATGGEETRGKNIATMIIIKTDKAVADVGEGVPTNVIVTPSTVNLPDGASQQFSATVLPASIADLYPVTWSVTDPALGSINQNGLYTSVSSAAGQQTVIASVSTGLHGMATINQYIPVTSIVINTIPDVTVGQTFSPVIVVSPVTATEPLVYSSSDDGVASFFDGVVYGNSPGPALVTASGQYSGVSGSQSVNVTQAAVTEKYLQIANNLSEIAAAGPTAQEEARSNLDISAPVGSLGAVGAYAFMAPASGAPNNYTPGATAAGSDLRYAGTVVSMGAPVPAGTWMCMGGMSNVERTLFQRIA